MTPSGRPAHDPDDRTLLAAHVAGDPQAFGTLFRRHRGRLWAVALRTTGDPEEAADALQDAMVSAFRRAEGYRGDATVTTWLHRIVVNACLDRLRRRRTRWSHTADAPPEEYAEGGDRPGAAGGAGPPDPEEEVLGDERQRAVLAALATLPPEQRAALVLVDMHGFSVIEAAAVLGCAAGTVKSRCSRGRARLLPLLAALQDGNPGAGRDVPSAGRAGDEGAEEVANGAP